MIQRFPRGAIPLLILTLWFFCLYPVETGEEVQVRIRNAIPVEILDIPNDDGSALRLTWDTGIILIQRIIIEHAEGTGPYTVLDTLNSRRSEYVDDNLSPGVTYRYRFSFVAHDGVYTVEGLSYAPVAQWFNTGKLSLLISILLVSGAILYYIYRGRKGDDLFIRRISGLDSMEEAVGRASEMGKPILFVPGIGDIDDMQTIAGLTILGKLVRKTAEYDTEIIVPVSRSMVLATAREIVREAHLHAGRPDTFRMDSVFYLTDDQFGFVAGVDGIIVREKPAAIFLMGQFYAESLILAETGFSSGAIQTAGTAMPSQIPFFVTACDYTLIGEELFAASAYLSRDPYQMGCLKGQDFGKLIFVCFAVVGIILEISGVTGLSDFLANH